MPFTKETSVLLVRRSAERIPYLNPRTDEILNHPASFSRTFIFVQSKGTLVLHGFLVHDPIIEPDLSPIPFPASVHIRIGLLRNPRYFKKLAEFPCRISSRREAA